MKLILKFTIVALAAFLVSCATVDVTKTSKGYYAPTKASDVEIFATRPDKKYEELGIVTVMNFPPSEIAKMHNALREKAAPLGANAVIITSDQVVNNGWDITRMASGVAVRYK